MGLVPRVMPMNRFVAAVLAGVAVALVFASPGVEHSQPTAEQQYQVDHSRLGLGDTD